MTDEDWVSLYGNPHRMNPETMMLRCAIEADDEWLAEVQAERLLPENLSDVIADSLDSRLSMLAKGRHDLKETVMLALAVGSVWRIDFERLARHFASGE